MPQSISKGVYLILTGIALIILSIIPGAISFFLVDTEMASSSDFEDFSGVYRYTFNDIGPGQLMVTASVGSEGTAHVNITFQDGSVVKAFSGDSLSNSTSIRKKGDYTVSITGVTDSDTFGAEYTSDNFITYCCLGCLGTSALFMTGLVLVIIGIVAFIVHRRKASTPQAQPAPVTIKLSEQTFDGPRPAGPRPPQPQYHLPRQYSSQPYYISPTFQIPYYQPQGQAQASAPRPSGAGPSTPHPAISQASAPRTRGGGPSPPPPHKAHAAARPPSRTKRAAPGAKTRPKVKQPQDQPVTGTPVDESLLP